MRFDLVSIDGPGQNSVHYRSEAELREALAAYGWLHGWDMQQEVGLGQWGRADLVCRAAGNLTLAVELKKSGSQFGTVRKAVQQAAGYGHALDEAGESVWPMAVFGGDVADEFAAAMGAFNPRVYVCSVSSFLGLLRLTGDAGVAGKRLTALQHQFDLLASTAADLATQPVEVSA